MKVFITKSAVSFLIISFGSLILLPYINFSSVKAIETVSKCDVQPNNKMVYANSEYFPYIKLQEAKIESDLPPEGYEWIVFADFIGDPPEYSPDYPVLGRIRTKYIDVVEDGVHKKLFDIDRMSTGPITVGHFSPYPNNSQFHIRARGSDGQFKCEHAGDDWVINTELNDPAIGSGDTETFGPAELDEIDTSFGTFPSDPTAFAARFLTIAIGVAGGVAFLLMVYGAYRLIFAGGNPESIQSARQIITAAIVGLLMIIFSVFILRLIGISILGLPL